MKKAPDHKAYFDLKPFISEDPTVTTVLCGIRLRALRKHYFGPRNKRGGSPMKLYTLGEFKTWAGMLMTLTGLALPCVAHWIRVVDAFQRKAEHEGINLREVLEKPPWDWTPAETFLVNDTVHKFCAGKTQQQILKESPPKTNILA